jgi:hypothetical protein
MRSGHARDLLAEQPARLPLDIEPGPEFVRLLADAAGFDFDG